MPLPIRTYWAQLARTVYETDKFLTKHQATLIATATVVDPVDVVAITAAFAALHAAAILFLHVHSLIDPNARPSE